jgi:hypothetical protein
MSSVNRYDRSMRHRWRFACAKSPCDLSTKLLKSVDVIFHQSKPAGPFNRRGFKHCRRNGNLALACKLSDIGIGRQGIGGNIAFDAEAKLCLFGELSIMLGGKVDIRFSVKTGVKPAG